MIRCDYLIDLYIHDFSGKKKLSFEVGHVVQGIKGMVVLA